MRITEARLRRLIREMASEQPLYTGVIISDPGTLRQMIYTQGLDRDIEGWETSNIAAHGNEQLNHHMTLTPGALKTSDPTRDFLGATVELTVVGWGVNHKLGVAAWQVLPPEGLPIKSGVPHITAALGDAGVKPFLATKITDWSPLDTPFVVQGTLDEVFPVPSDA